MAWTSPTSNSSVSWRPPEASEALSGASPGLIDSIHNHIQVHVARYPGAKNWRSNSLTFAGCNLLLRAFPHSRERAERELGFVADYWLGHRPAWPTSMPAKCSCCLYNKLRQCRKAVAPYTRVGSATTVLAGV